MIANSVSAVRHASEKTARPFGPISSQPRINLFGAIELPTAMMRFDRNEEIYGEDEPADFVYKIVSGAVRTCKILSDGRRQIEAFHLPGDVFGLEMGGSHRFSAEAVADCEIALVKASVLKGLASRDHTAAQTLWTLTSHELKRTQDHMLLLGRKNALERVVAFLLEMRDRTPGTNAVDLPMSRNDIADYLGLTIETVSRTQTLLERERSIALPSSRHIELRNPGALIRLNA
jgi:CRP/FNR family nitrogen fixation transcriptional regulator